MPRAKRLELPGVAQHVIQRGNDRQACFFEAADYLCYLQALREAALRYACQVHAYVLMANHVRIPAWGLTDGMRLPAQAGSRRKCPLDTYQRGFRIGRFAPRFSCRRCGRKC